MIAVCWDAAGHHQGCAEVCDGVDNDCDGTIDEVGAFGEQTFYIDGDGDGYGEASVTVDACEQPTGYINNNLDCDDGNPLLTPIPYQQNFSHACMCVSYPSYIIIYKGTSHARIRICTNAHNVRPATGLRGAGRKALDHQLLYNDRCH